MTNLTEVEVPIFRPRKSPVVGRPNNRLKPSYVARLEKVNTRRAEIGLRRVLD